MKQDSDIDVINRVLGGDVSGYAVLVDRYKNMAFTIAYRIIGQREDAEEIVQDAFLKAYKNLSRFRRKASFSTWLYRIAYNTAISKKRLKKIPQASLDDVPQSTYAGDEGTMADRYSDEAEKERILEKALGCLNETEKTLVTLYYLNESNIDEIHQITGLSKSNVKVRLFRARKKLQTFMSDTAHAVYF